MQRLNIVISFLALKLFLFLCLYLIRQFKVKYEKMASKVLGQKSTKGEDYFGYVFCMGLWSSFFFI